MGKWRDAHIGADSQHITLRATDEEKERLEQLRQELRLTSRGQVIRAALDLLEQIGVGSEVLTAGDPEQARRAVRRIRRHVGVPRRADLDAAPTDDAIATRRKVVTSFKHVRGGGLLDAECGSPASAPAAPTAPADDVTNVTEK